MIIIGGGISGAASAFFLAEAGLEPVIVERLPALASLTTARSMEALRAQFVEPENVAMMRESIAFYEHFAERTGLSGVDIGLHQQGYLFLTTEPGGAARFWERVTFLLRGWCVHKWGNYFHRFKPVGIIMHGNALCAQRLQPLEDCGAIEYIQCRRGPQRSRSRSCPRGRFRQFLPVQGPFGAHRFRCMRFS